MAHLEVQNRILKIHGPGTLLVSSDLHGNIEDFRRLVELFEREKDAVLVCLGDLFHGPNLSAERWARECPHLGDYYPDESATLLREFLALSQRYPGRVGALMGNHEYAHVGGPVVSKFHDDEAVAFEHSLWPHEIPRLHAFIAAMPLIGVSGTGLVLTHGAPPPTPFDHAVLAEFGAESYVGDPLNASPKTTTARLVRQLLWQRISPLEDVEAFLGHLAPLVAPWPCDVVVYGHQRAHTGYAIAHQRLLNLSTSFGMTREAKTWLRVELDRPVSAANSLRPGQELLALYS